MLPAIALLLALPALAHAVPKTESYTYLYTGKIITVKIGEAEGVRVNDLCLESEKTCSALRIFHAPSRAKELRLGRAAHYAEAYCQLLGGTTVYLQKGEGSPFCVFADLTMIDAKALYRKHSGAKP